MHYFTAMCNSKQMLYENTAVRCGHIHPYIVWPKLYITSTAKHISLTICHDATNHDTYWKAGLHAMVHQSLICIIRNTEYISSCANPWYLSLQTLITYRGAPIHDTYHCQPYNYISRYSMRSSICQHIILLVCHSDNGFYSTNSCSCSSSSTSSSRSHTGHFSKGGDLLWSSALYFGRGAWHCQHPNEGVWSLLICVNILFSLYMEHYQAFMKHRACGVCTDLVLYSKCIDGCRNQHELYFFSFLMWI